MSRPVPYNVRPKATAFLDARTAGGTMTDGRTLPARVKRDATAAHYLQVAHAAGVERVYLTRKAAPRKGWLFTPTPDWTGAGHYVDEHGLDVGRWTHATGFQVEVRQAAEWFGWGDYTPRTAADAWRALADVHRVAFGSSAQLLASPSGTGQDAWARTIPRDRDVPQLDDELQQLIRATSCQHHVELRQHDAPLEGFVYMDGRFMFSALTKELGVGPVVRDAVDTAGGYERARYRVRATVPHDWHLLGILPLKVGPGEWEWPDQPGRTFETWADGAETKLAREWGWELEVLERLLFTRGRPLDTWTDKLTRARATVDTWDDTPVRAMVKGALRAQLIQTIGAFHSTGRDITRVSFSPLLDPPPPNVATSRHGDAIVWREPQPLTGRASAFRHPEWSSAVWGRGHARILAHVHDGDLTGALGVPPEWLVGVRGDALYLTTDPEWPDDGRNGRLRVKGRLSGPVPAPADLNDLNDLRARAEKAGTS